MFSLGQEKGKNGSTNLTDSGTCGKVTEIKNKLKGEVGLALSYPTESQYDCANDVKGRQ